MDYAYIKHLINIPFSLNPFIQTSVISFIMDIIIKVSFVIITSWLNNDGWIWKQWFEYKFKTNWICLFLNVKWTQCLNCSLLLIQPIFPKISKYSRQAQFLKAPQACYKPSVSAYIRIWHYGLLLILYLKKKRLPFVKDVPCFSKYYICHLQGKWMIRW